MRKIKKIVVHCSATREGCDINAKDIDRWHKKRGFSQIGYHFVITLNGEVQEGRDLRLKGAHVKGHNHDSIGICYVGGLDFNGKARDTRTTAQRVSLSNLITNLSKRFNCPEILGHRDLSPDLDGDGVVEKHEWLKECPCFNAKKEYETI